MTMTAPFYHFPPFSCYGDSQQTRDIPAFVLPTAGVTHVAMSSF